MNKNKIFALASFFMAVLGIGLIIAGFFIYPDYTIGFGIAGFGFIVVAWAFNALKGRV